MGNRGILHNDCREIVRPFAHKAWVCCAKSFKDIDRRPLFRTPPSRYSELFFLDEVTAYAAGHRPCNYCRREAAKRFKQLWCQANRPEVDQAAISVKEIDLQIHRERVGKNKEKIGFISPLSDLPHGAMFEVEGEVFAVCKCNYMRWSFTGYEKAEHRFPQEVNVLTPHSIIMAFRAGLIPDFHNSVAG